MFRRIDAALNAGAIRITKVVGTVYTAIFFAGLTLFSLPATIAAHSVILLVQWLGSVFLQLVLLPIIMVGQNQHTDRLDAIHETTQAVHNHIKGT